VYIHASTLDDQSIGESLHRLGGEQGDATALAVICCVEHVERVVARLPRARNPHLVRLTFAAPHTTHHTPPRPPRPPRPQQASRYATAAAAAAAASAAMCISSSNGGGGGSAQQHAHASTHSRPLGCPPALYSGSDALCHCTRSSENAMLMEAPFHLCSTRRAMFSRRQPASRSDTLEPPPSTASSRAEAMLGTHHTGGTSQSTASPKHHSRPAVGPSRL
jgi:hypothetical protein